MPRQCIFCGGKPVTKEHIFGAWLSPLFPPPPGKRMFLDVETIIDGQPTKEPRRYPRNIDMKVKQVCLSCNTGWMSKLEEDVLGIVPNVHSGSKHSITSEEQTLLASWAAKTAVTIQYLNKTPLVPERRRKWLLAHQTPPPDTCIWIARYDGAGVATCGSKDLFMKANPKTLSAPVGQAAFFSIGSLLFVVLSVYFENIGVRVEFPTSLVKHLFQIWPKDIQLLAWPSQGLDDSLRTELFSLDWGKSLWFRQASHLSQEPPTKK